MNIRLEVQDHVARVVIDRPQVLNAIDSESEAELQDIWSSLESNREIRVIVLTGAGEKAFCVGADMKDESPAGSESGLAYWAKPRPNGFGGIALRSTLDVPVIARVNGYANLDRRPHLRGTQ